MMVFRSESKTLMIDEWGNQANGSFLFFLYELYCNYGIVNPLSITNLVKLMGPICENIRYGEQNCAADFYTYLHNLIVKEVEIADLSPTYDSEFQVQINETERKEHAESNILNYSLIHAVFYSKTDLNEALDELFLKDPKFKRELRTLPSVLTFNVSRFDDGYKKKSKKKYKYAYDLDLSKYYSNELKLVQENLKIRYSLQSIVIHSGSVNSGHYYVFTRKIESDRSVWYKLNDEQVNRVEKDTVDKIASEEGTIFFYRKISQ